MIQLCAKRLADGAIYRLEARGHAGYAERGEDIVCAAVTAILATAATGLTDVLHLEPELHFAEGDIRVEIDRQSCRSAAVQNILETCFLGVKQLVLNYGEYVQTSEEREI